jgi:hypothetical protein
MTFKMGETCDGCDAIVKNLKKISEANKGKNAYDVVENSKQVKGIKGFMEEQVDDNKKTTKKVAKNISQVGK